MTERRKQITKILSLTGIGLVASASALWFVTGDKDTAESTGNEAVAIAGSGSSSQTGGAWTFEIADNQSGTAATQTQANPFGPSSGVETETAVPALVTDTSPAEPVAPKRPERDTLMLQVNGNTLDVHASDHRLSDLLAGISDQSGVRIAYDGVVGDETLSIRFEGLPLDEGLRRLLTGYDSFFLYSATGKVEAAWVVERGDGDSMEPVAPSTMVAMAAEEPPESVATDEHEPTVNSREVLDDLNDSDPSVRSAALFSAYEIGTIPDDDRLATLARSEPDAATRGFALAMLGEQSGLDSNEYRSLVSEMASREKDMALREEARGILEELDRRDREGEPVQGEE